MGARVSVERTIHCDAAECNVHARTANPAPYCPAGFLSVQWWSPGNQPFSEYHFCGWECAMRHGATFPPPTIIRLDDGEGGIIGFSEGGPQEPEG